MLYYFYAKLVTEKPSIFGDTLRFYEKHTGWEKGIRMKNNKEREKLKQQYISEWVGYKAEHPDMPLKTQFKNKAEYRQAKNEWNARNSDWSDYANRRVLALTEKGFEDLAKFYLHALTAV